MFDKISKRTPPLSLSLNYLHLQTGRIKIRLKPIEEKNIWACDMKHAKLKIALILSNVRLCRTKADISKSVQNGFSSETFVTRSMDWPKHCIVLFHIQRNQANAGTKDHRVQAPLPNPPPLSLSLSLSLFFYDLLSKFANNLVPEDRRVFCWTWPGANSHTKS